MSTRIDAALNELQKAGGHLTLAGRQLGGDFQFDTMPADRFFAQLRAELDALSELLIKAAEVGRR